MGPLRGPVLYYIVYFNIINSKHQGILKIKLEYTVQFNRTDDNFIVKQWKRFCCVAILFIDRNLLTILQHRSEDSVVPVRNLIVKQIFIEIEIVENIFQVNGFDAKTARDSKKSLRLK